MHTGFIRVLWGVSLLLLLAACSSDDARPPPAELQTIKPEITLDRAWWFDVGGGSAEQILDLRPLFLDGTLYVVDAEGLVTAIEPVEGERLWKSDLDRPITAGIAGSQGLLFMAEETGKVFAFDTVSKTVLWEAGLTSESVVKPLTVNDVVIVQTIDGRVTAFGQKDGIKRWEYANTTEPSLSLRGDAVPLLFKDAVIIGLSNGMVVSLSVRTGEVQWEQRVAEPKGRTELERLIDVDSAIFVVDNRLFAVAYQGRLVELDPYSGAVVWATDASSYSDLSVGYNSLFITTPEGEVVAFKRDGGAKVWSNNDLSYRYLGAPVAWQSYVLVPDFEGYIHVLNQTDGRIVGRFRPGNDDGIRVPAFVANDLIYIYSNDGTLSAWRQE